MSRLRRVPLPYLGLGAILLGALVLRVWGIDHGLPNVFNVDEERHFVRHAVRFFTDGYNPHYFVNPPGYTYLVHGVLAVAFLGKQGALEAWAHDPAQVFLAARLTAALAGVVAVWLVYVAAARMFDGTTGLVAGAILAVAFLPVFYGHSALNDGVTLLPVGLSLVGTAGILRGGGRLHHYAVAGLGIGFAAATKYPGAIVALPLVGAAVYQFVRSGERRPAIVGLVLAGGTSLMAFVVANPYSVLAPREFLEGLPRVAPDHTGKFGRAETSVVGFYLWTFTWGLGWAPLAAGVLGSVLLLRRDRWAAAVLVPAPILYVLYLGTRPGFFSRWLLPVFPIVAILGAVGSVYLIRLVARRAPRAGPAAAVVVVGALLVQGLFHSVDTDMALARSDTRTLVRDWAERHIPPGETILVETRVDMGQPFWNPKPPQLREERSPWDVLDPRPIVAARVEPAADPERVGISRYVQRLDADVLDEWIEAGICWVITGSKTYGRVFTDKDSPAGPLAYYRELDRRAELVQTLDPYRPGRGPLEFSFEFSNNYYPFAFHRPGPEMRIYRVSEPRCR